MNIFSSREGGTGSVRVHKERGGGLAIFVQVDDPAGRLLTTKTQTKFFQTQTKFSSKIV